MKTFMNVLTFVLCLYCAFCASACTGGILEKTVATAQIKKDVTTEQSTSNCNKRDLVSIKYETLNINCKESKCFSIIYVASKYFNKSDMEILAKKLSEDFDEKSTINIDIFDDVELAKAHKDGRREARERQFDRRGVYSRFDTQEFLLFFPDKGKNNKPTVIDLAP